MLSTIRSLKDADIFVNDRIRSDGSAFICYLGEEITINNTIWQVVGIDTELGKGDIPLTQHHISLVPKTILTTDRIQSSGNCNGGYANSDMHRYVIPSIVAKLEHVLGDHLLERRVKLTNTTFGSTHKASGNEYYTVKANLMCQMQVFGTINSEYGDVYDIGDDTKQLPGFATGKVAKGSDSWYWLRDVYGYYSRASAYCFSLVHTGGSLGYTDVNYSYGGVRPLITIG